MVWGSVAPPAAAEARPFEAHQARLTRQAEKMGHRPEGMVPLLELWRMREEVDPAHTRKNLERLARSPRLSAARRTYAGALLARSELRAGEVEAALERVRELGYVTGWRVAGPFDNGGKSGFESELPPEATRQDPVDLSATWPGKERPVSWRTHPKPAAPLGYVDLDAVLRPNTQACAFAETFIDSDRARPLSLWVGAGGAFKVWWNGERVLEDDKYRHPDPDRHVALVGAREGANRLLVKTCVDEGTWGFFLRLGDEDGAPVALEADATKAVRGPTEPARRPLPGAPQAPLEALEEAAEGDRARAAAIENLARFLAYTGADDPAEHRARQLAARAARADPTVGRWKLAASLAGHRSEVMRFVKRARELAPDHPQTRFLRARLAASGPRPEQALPLLEGLEDGGGRLGMEAALVRADVLGHFDLDESALAATEDVAEKAPRSERFIRAVAGAVAEVGHADRHHDLQREILALRFDHRGTRRALIKDAMRRQDVDELETHLAALQTLASKPSDLVYVAHIREALDQDARALEAFEKARLIAPEDAEVLVSYGRMLLRLDQEQAAVGALRDALAIRPQDARTRELLEQIEKPEARPDERHAIDREALLARRVDPNGYPLTLLQELTVNTVYDNGLGSSFRQVAAQVHDDEGTRRWRTYSIPFDPTSQRAEIREARVHRADGQVLEARNTFVKQLGKPWYRIYYDTRALVVVFPDLEPGDVVELRYRVDDIAHRNLFADYYGDLEFFQGFNPSRHVEYILSTPQKRDFHIRKPDMKGLSHRRSKQGERRIDRFVAEDVPALRSEDGMPGMTEIAPFLHVSTYRNWDEIGQWY
ncbi:MAG: DUF3857 domain-containing protein, partial [Myxococcota bacterium]